MMKPILFNSRSNIQDVKGKMQAESYNHSSFYHDLSIEELAKQLIIAEDGNTYWRSDVFDPENKGDTVTFIVEDRQRYRRCSLTDLQENFPQGFSLIPNFTLAKVLVALRPYESVDLQDEAFQCYASGAPLILPVITLGQGGKSAEAKSLLRQKREENLSVPFFFLNQALLSMINCVNDNHMLGDVEHFKKTEDKSIKMIEAINLKKNEAITKIKQYFLRAKTKQSFSRKNLDDEKDLSFIEANIEHAITENVRDFEISRSNFNFYWSTSLLAVAVFATTSVLGLLMAFGVMSAFPATVALMFLVAVVSFSYMAFAWYSASYLGNKLGDLNKKRGELSEYKEMFEVNCRQAPAKISALQSIIAAAKSFLKKINEVSSSHQPTPTAPPYRGVYDQLSERRVTQSEPPPSFGSSDYNFFLPDSSSGQQTSLLEFDEISQLAEHSNQTPR